MCPFFAILHFCLHFCRQSALRLSGGEKQKVAVARALTVSCLQPTGAISARSFLNKETVFKNYRLTMLAWGRIG